MRRSRCRSNSKVGLCFAAFGAGMLISLICPKSVMVAVLSMTIVVLGIIISK